MCAEASRVPCEESGIPELFCLVAAEEQPDSVGVDVAARAWSARGGELPLMYSIGSKVVHPRHGAGTIVRVQEKRFGDVSNTYYVIDTVSRQMQVMVPVERAQSIGLRSVQAASELRQVLASCHVAPSEDEVEKDYRARQNVVGEQLKSGRYDEVASAVRVLFYMNSQRALGTTDRALFDRGKDILAGELALASDLEILEAMQEVEDNLAEMLFPEDE